MFKMMKWGLMGAAAAGVLGFLFLGTHAPSYFRTAFGSLRAKVKEQIPVEFELQRARQLIEAIDPEIEDCRRDVARAEVELDALHEEIGRLTSDVDRGRAKVLAHREMLADRDGNVFTLEGIPYTRREIMLDLERAFDLLCNNEALLQGKKALVEKQGRSVEAARGRLEAVRGEKARLEDLVEALAVQKRKMDALAASSRRIHLDTSNLSHARDVLEEVKKRLAVARKILHSDLALDAGVSGPEAANPRPGLLKDVDAWIAGTR